MLVDQYTIVWYILVDKATIFLLVYYVLDLHIDIQDWLKLILGLCLWGCLCVFFCRKYNLFFVEEKRHQSFSFT